MFSISRLIVPVLVCLTAQSMTARAGNSPERSASLEGAQLAQAVEGAPAVPNEGSSAAASAGGGAEMKMEAKDKGKEANPFLQPDFNQIIPELTAKDAEFQNIIRLIALKTGINILLDQEEIDGKKRLTFQLKNVPLGYALDTILKTHKLAYILEDGGIIRIVPESRVGREAVETHTEIIELNWRDARDIETTFKTFLSTHGSMKSNDEAQAIIITDVPPHVERIKALIRQIDRPDRQVVIEARLVDVQLESLRNFTTRWSLSKTNNLRNVTGTRTTTNTGSASSSITRDITSVTDPFSGLTETTTSGPSGTLSSNSSSQVTDSLLQALGASDPIAGVASVLAEGFGFNAGNGRTPTLQFGSTVGIFGDKFTLDATLTALENRQLVEVLSSPRVTTLNNVTANINIIQRIPYTQGEIVAQQAVITIRFEEAGEKIAVKPVITPDGHIRLDISLTQDIFRGRVGPGDLDPPLIDERMAKSTVIVKDKNTVVLGGLRGLRTAEIIDAFPWLHRIPVIG
ncbi:secretin and TonB N-terminal domain-containing protein, partial [Candidatus Sumerlaeota bacterium]|nr:secretin and TonB N-terminal domain-containing protein [Candidatus Sumerlaeota bacterium]